MLRFTSLITLLLVIGYHKFALANENNVNKPEVQNQVQEPPFPSLINNEDFSYYIHITSESIIDGSWAQTAEEYVDLRNHKNAYVTYDSRGRLVTYIDDLADVMYHYRDYFCDPAKVSDLNPYQSGLWLTELEYLNRQGSQAKSRVHGIAAIWINAAKRPKVYKKTSWANKTLSQVYPEAHRWTVDDVATNTQAHLYFVETETSGSGQSKLELQLIVIESTQMKKILRSIRIISVDSYVSEEVKTTVLQVPVGYGCHGSLDSARLGFKTMEMMYFGDIFRENYLLKIEATATLYDSVKEASGEVVRSLTDTIAVELMKTNQMGRNDLQMIRTLDPNQDTKVVYDHFYKVQYDVDLKRGTCKMSNFGGILGDFEERKIVLKFQNTKKELKMDLVTMHLLFVDREDYYFIKRVDSADSILLYFEKTSTDLFPGNITRIIRVYSAVIKPGESPTSKLETVIIKVFNQYTTGITTTFHINIVEAFGIESLSEMSKLFDISEECYLNNELMKSGRDYAWLEFSYLLPNHIIETVDQNLENLRAVGRDLLMGREIFMLNAPRMEIELNEDTMLLRVLLLDLPPLPVLYERRADTTFVRDKSEGDIEDLAQDLAHCADLCRLYRCKIFSYSQATFLCQLAISRDNAFPMRTFTPTTGYSTFSMAQKEDQIYDDLFRSSLHNMIADLQHKDYDFKIPPMPDELRLPASETGISVSERNKISREYYDNINKLRRDDHNQIPILSFIIMYQGASVPLMPSRIEVERDPLEEFDLFDKRASLSGSEDNQDDNIPTTASFHLGLSLHHYLMSGLAQEAETRARSMKFHDLTYEQCALACVDGKCSSFSYCNNRQECIVTDIWDIGAKMSTRAVERDSDCFIAQRDFISKFNKFSGMARPLIYRKSVKALNPSECAHACVIETDYNCLAFDYCPARSELMTPGPILDEQGGTCFYRSERFISTGSANVSSVVDQLKPSRRYIDSDGCDHYSRSYLADFTRIEYRAIDELVLGKLKTDTSYGLSVDQCADKCVNDLSDCTAFQFCFNPNNPAKTKHPMQECVMIDSKPEGLTDEDLQVVVKENSTSEELLKVSKLFQPDDFCHVFSLRKDSSEAHLRNLALNAISVNDYEQKRRMVVSGSSGLTFGGSFLLFLSIGLVSTGLVSILLLARDKSELVRTHTDKLGALVRLH